MTTSSRDELIFNWADFLGLIRARLRTPWGGAVAETGLFIARRLASGALILLLIVTISHGGLAMAAGTPIAEVLADAVAALPRTLGRMLVGDFGMTAAGSVSQRPIPVSFVAPAAVARTVGLLTAALLLASLGGIGLGIWAAIRRHTGWSIAALLLSILGVSLPSFFLALLLQLGVIRWTRLSGNRILPVGGFGWDAHIILPAVVLAARPLAQIFRITYVRVGEILEQDYVRTARSKGLWPNLIIWRHVMKNAAVPILTTIGLSFRFALISLPVVEYFFGWSGIGFYLLKSIAEQDQSLTTVLFLALGAMVILVNLLLEGSYRWFNPNLDEAPSTARHGGTTRILSLLQSFILEARDWLQQSPIVRRLGWGAEPRGFRRSHSPLSRDSVGEISKEEGDKASTRRRAFLRALLTNFSLILGTLVVGSLIVIFAFGPRLAPLSPYTTRGLSIESGEFLVPPFPPSEAFALGTDALGRDLLSLILVGAQKTLLLAGLVVAVRLAVGLLAGALAGWMRGTWLDRALLSLSEIIASVPSLLLAMILILGLGIHGGMRPFILALGMIGWGEIMQLVRAEVISLRPKLFIEAATAIGARAPRILQHHVLPNLVPTLISITALEMGAVLMILGELGFIGIFLGGGAFAELDIFGAPYHYSDVPEWSALLSNVRTYARGYPWMGLYPGLAFFLAILGFNLFGEGLRRLIERTGSVLSRFMNRHLLLFAVLAVFGFSWLQENSGAIAIYRRHAEEFDGGRAMAHAGALTMPSIEGRSLGSDGLATSAGYIAAEFEALGLQPAGQTFSYFYQRQRGYEQLTAVPCLAIEGDDGTLEYRRDYAEFAGDSSNMGQALAPVTLLAWDSLSSSSSWGRSYYPALEDLDLTDTIVMLPSADLLAPLRFTPRPGTLIVVENPQAIRGLRTLSDLRPTYTTYGTGRERGRQAPSMLVTEAVADRILRSTGRSFMDYREKIEWLEQDELMVVDTQTAAAMEIRGEIHSDDRVQHVIGHWPGQLAPYDRELVMVLAQYDCPPTPPDGAAYACANDNASGVALMLEAIRAMRDTEYEPYRTLLFVAYAGEGTEGGKDVSYPDPSTFLSAKYGFDRNFELEAVVRLRGVAAGEGDHLLVQTGGSARLADLMEEAAEHKGVPTMRSSDPFDITVIFEEGERGASGLEAPEVGLSWEGWQETARSADDTFEQLSEAKFEGAGETLTEALMVLGRERDY